MTESGSDDRIAPVSYLFGGARASEPDADSAAPPTSGGHGDGWYVEPSAPTSPTSRRPVRSPVFVATPEQEAFSPQAPTPADPVSPTRRPTTTESPAMQKMRLLVEAAEAEKAAQAKNSRTAAPKRAGRFAPITDSFVDDGDTDDGDDNDDELPPESAEEQAARAENVSMAALTRKGMSSWEMAEKLRARDLDEEIVLNEIDRLERVALLDDRELADTLVRTLQDRKGLGRSGITAELRRRHIDPNAIEEALDALDTDDELVRATEIAIKRAPQLRSFDDVTAKRRLSAFLMRKGYSGSIISAAVTAALLPGRGPRFR
ncbi:MAG: RecX family transcriptional regulator [Glaciihabitans sp.]|nr:RecX family transcriptional regulator [Glaciihabitans sp.]